MTGPWPPDVTQAQQWKQPLDRRCQIHTRCNCPSHPKGWIDEAGTQQWMRTMQNTRPEGATISKRFMLLWDMCCAHITESCRKMGLDLVTISGGLSSVLQPLDMCLFIYILF